MLGAGISWLFYDRYFLELLIALLIINIVCFGIAYRYFGETRPEHYRFEHGVGILAGLANYRQVFKDRAFVLFTIGTILFSSVWLQMDNYVPVHLKLYFEETDVLGIHLTSSKMLSLMVFTNTLLIVLLMTLINRLTAKWRLLPQLVIGSVIRSEEHTSELQSRQYLVCRLLLEKKKKY